MNNYLIFSSDERSYLDLKNVVLELKNRNLPYFFLYSNSSNRISPQQSLDNFSYDTNVKYTEEKYFSKTLGFELPFKPDVLLITNENWEPEKTILWEFKQWGCFIGCIENSSWTFNNIKTKLEIASRKTFPTNCIDIFFDHSKWGLETKTQAGWWYQKSIITGNPRFDNFLFSPTKENIIIVYGSMEKEHHNKLLKIYSNIKLKLPNWDIYYKPHPSELRDFNDFKNINIIFNQDQLLKIIESSSYNIGIFSSIMYYPLLMGKNVVNIDFSSSGASDELNMENFRGHEFNFWNKILNFNTFKNFSKFISYNFIKKTKERNEFFENQLKKNLPSYDKDCTFITKSSENLPVLKYFDDYNDGKASNRIINYIENE